MKQQYYLAALVIAGITLASYWMYDRYLKDDVGEPLLLAVDRGAIEQTVRVRGEVASEKEFDLEFPFSGTLERVWMREGDAVAGGARLMKLETVDFEIERARLAAVRAAREANLLKLRAGARSEAIEVAEAKVASARVTEAAAERELTDAIRDAYAKSDNAVRNEADLVFKNPRTSSPQLRFDPANSQDEINLESQRVALETLFVAWQGSLSGLSAETIDAASALARQNLLAIQSFLNTLAPLVNELTAAPEVSKDTIDEWKSAVSSARTAVNAALTARETADAGLRAARSALTLAERERDLARAAARSEDIAIAEAEVNETIQQIEAVDEKIRKSTLTAPSPARVVKLWVERGEVFRPGAGAISLALAGHKVQAEVSELDIALLTKQDGAAPARITFDAMPERVFAGKMISVEPREIIKEGDAYYRVNFEVEPHGDAIRSGMRADVAVPVSRRDDAVRVMEFAVLARDGKTFVKVWENGAAREQEVETGISDGERIEIVRGLVPGEVVAVFPEAQSE